MRAGPYALGRFRPMRRLKREGVMRGGDPEGRREALKGKATMKDVARLAGASLASVSRVLSASAPVSEPLSKRIADAARELDYAVNINARGLRGKSSGLVVVLVPDIANPFFSVVFQGVEEQARSRNMAVLIGDTGIDRGIAEGYWRLIKGHRADGVILLNGFLPYRAGARGAGDYPIVVVSERIKGAGAPTVGIDNVAAASEAVGYLAELGHRRVAHIEGPSHNILTRQRREGYRKAVERHGLERWPEAVQPGDFTLAAGRRAMARLVECDPPTALFAANDEMAIGAVLEAKARGLRAPGDLSVVGFDDIDFAEAFDPPLTTIRQPRREMGRTAMQILCRMIDEPDEPRADVLLEHRLIVRGSASPPSAVRTVGRSAASREP